MSSGSSRHPPTRSWRRRRHEPPGVNPALAGVALVVIVGAVVAGSARNARTAILGLVVALVAAPLLADPPAAPLGLAARLVAAVLAGYLLWVATRGPAARTGGTLVGWPTEAFLSILPVLNGRDILRIGLGLLLLLTGALLVRTSLGGTPAELEDILTAGLVATLGGAVALLAIASRSDGRPGFELSATTPHRSSHGADAHPIEPE